jgi:repressor of nif and glnA expression
MKDLVTEEILNLILKSEEPLETKEIEEKIKNKIKKESVTRTKVFYRLNLLRGEGRIKGKFIGSGKGVWIWWSEILFKGEKKNEK